MHRLCVEEGSLDTSSATPEQDAELVDRILESLNHLKPAGPGGHVPNVLRYTKPSTLNPHTNSSPNLHPKAGPSTLTLTPTLTLTLTLTLHADAELHAESAGLSRSSMCPRPPWRGMLRNEL